jgi:hypothetical protein
LNPPIPILDIERFADICALLDDGFSIRVDVLAAAGLDETGWQRARAKWLAILSASTTPELAQRFARAYGRARQRAGYVAISERARASDSTWLTVMDGDEPACSSRAPMPLDTDRSDLTAHVAFPLAGPALPFRSYPVGATASLERAPVTLSRPQPPAGVDPAEPTLEVPVLSTPPTVLPFRTTPQRRLHRFDSQTGLPLAVPVWVDELPPQSPRF